MRCFKSLFAFLMLSGLFAGQAAFAQQILLHRGAIWKYLDDGSNQGTAWYATAFNDSAWAAGAAQLGYGDGDEVSTVSFGSNSNQKYITTYFRTTFNVTNASAIPGLVVDLLRDDGAIVYLNGTEIVRDNLPSGTISYNSTASSTVSGSSEDLFFRFLVPSTALVNGTNVLAVEIHQRSSTSSDISFDLELSVPGDPGLNRGPYLQLGTPTSVNVKWRTDIPATSKIWWGKTYGMWTDSMIDQSQVADHEMKIANLDPNTKYYYRIGSDTLNFSNQDSNQHFITSPQPGTRQLIRAWVLGDCGTADLSQRSVRNAYYNYANSLHTDMILMLGDNAYNSGTDQEYQRAMFENMYEDQIRKTVTWSCIGNHDMGVANATTQTGPYFDIYTFPTGGEAGGLASGTEAYYSWDYGNVHFISLDSHESDRSPIGPMLTWLQNDLASTTADWIIALWHHPPYSKGSHNSDTETQLIQMRVNAVPILEAAGVDLVLNGHSHSYERSFLLKGHYGTTSTFNSSMVLDGGDGQEDGDGAYRKATTGATAGDGAVYVVAGSSGKISGGSLNHPAMHTSLNLLGSCVLEIQGGRLDLQFLNPLGAITDYFTILKDSLPVKVGDEVVTPRIMIHPNPNSGRVKISSAGTITQKVRVRVMDVTGKTVLEKRLPDLREVRELDLSSLSDGALIVEFSFAGRKLTKKILLKR